MYNVYKVADRYSEVLLYVMDYKDPYFSLQNQHSDTWSGT